MWSQVAQTHVAREECNVIYIKARRCGSVYLGVVVLGVCELCYVYEGYVGRAAVLYI